MQSSEHMSVPLPPAMYSISSNSSFPGAQQSGWFQDYHGPFKRKEDPLAEEEVVQLMSGVCLSPQKRQRLCSDAPTHAPNGHASATLFGVAQPSGVSPSPLGPAALPAGGVAPPWSGANPGLVAAHIVPPPEPGAPTGRPAAPALPAESSEKALVLYRSVQPPPPYMAGPMLPPPPLPPAAVVAAAGPLPGLPAALPAGPIVIPRSVLLPSAAGLIERSSPNFMKALDLTGVQDEPTNASSQRRLYRVNSCSSLPISFYNAKAAPQAMEEDDGPGSDKALAVIPWAPPAVPVAALPPLLNQNGVGWPYGVQQPPAGGLPPAPSASAAGSSPLPAAFSAGTAGWQNSDMDMGDNESAPAAVPTNLPIYVNQASAAAQPSPGLWH